MEVFITTGDLDDAFVFKHEGRGSWLPKYAPERNKLITVVVYTTLVFTNITICSGGSHPVSNSHIIAS